MVCVQCGMKNRLAASNVDFELHILPNYKILISLQTQTKEDRTILVVTHIL